VNAAQLAQIEQALGMTLPPEYRAVMLAYPFSSGSLAEELWLLDDPAQLIEINTDYRRDGFFGIPWPTHYFAVGGDGLGNAHFLDLHQAPAPVRFADHETGEFEDIAPDTTAWIATLWEELAEIEADRRVMAEAREHKRWWQFWIQ
jgi:hypothetical protein